MDFAAKNTCPICSHACELLDVVDFNKSCEEARGTYLKLSGIPINYTLCSGCGFCFASEMYTWPLSQFERQVYNGDYSVVDPDYKEARPRTNAYLMMNFFGSRAEPLKHLDYGGGMGLMSKILCDQGWNSTSYDPFVDRNVDIKKYGKFDVITAFEVFEHVPDVNGLLENLRSLLAPDGVILFSTTLSDKFIAKSQRLSWNYAAPRNGHISLFSKASLTALAKKFGFTLGHLSDNYHVMAQTMPNWKMDLLFQNATMFSKPQKLSDRIKSWIGINKSSS